MSTINLPDRYNASTTFVDANLEAGRGDKTAVICGDRRLTYAEMAAMVNRTGNALKRLGVRMEERVMLLLLDSPEFVASFFGAIRMGAVPVPTNTLLRPPDYEYLLNDSRATALIVSEPLYAGIEPIRPKLKFLRHVIVAGRAQGTPQDTLNFDEWIRDESPELVPADTGVDDACFWLYSSGTTGFPKGAVHLQHDMVYCAENYGRRVLDITDRDRTFSVAKLFFAYGLGNALYFPFYVGATTILHSGPPAPQAVYEITTKHRPTLFFSVPTGYTAMLAVPEAEKNYSLKSVRLCVSAGEALPKAVFERWKNKWGVEILDGIGSTEILHIFISNRAGRVKPGASGQVVPGYEAKIVDENDRPAADGEIGNLLIKGDSTCAFYWNKHEKSKQTIIGEWIRTGDKYLADEEGYYWYQGRSDDMLKVGGIWVSPVELESSLIGHPAVLESGVVGKLDADELVKPMAFVVLKEGYTPSPALEAELKLHVKNNLAPYKYPRWIGFTNQLPKTATGKIQRFKLREMAANPQETR
jgi:benzoate-CoA ligase family protein